MKKVITLLLFLILWSTNLIAEDAGKSIIIRGKKESVVTTATIRLGDVSEIVGTSPSRDDAVVALEKIVLGKSPPPGLSKALKADELVNILRAQGVDLNQVGYVLPKEMQVQRASRNVTELEIRSAIEQFLGVTRDSNTVVKELAYQRNFQVSPEDISLNAVQVAATMPGHIGFEVRMSGKEQPENSLHVNARIENWEEMPVAKRNLSKGDLIESGDVVRARLNTQHLPKDIVRDETEFLGLTAKGAIPSGSVFRKGALQAPTLIGQGDRVSMRYVSGMFEATSTGEALEAGMLGQSIKIRNTSSKRIVSGIVIDRGIVEVRP